MSVESFQTPATTRAARPLRVLMVVTTNQRRGAESFAAMLAERLEQAGLDVGLLSLSATVGEPALPIPALGGLPFSPGPLLALRREIAAADVVVAGGSRTLPATVIAGWRTKTPLIYQNIGDPDFWAPAGRRRTQVRALLRRVSAVAALTEASASTLRHGFDVPPERIRVLSNARDSRHFRPATGEERTRSRATLGIAQQGPVVTVIGALSTEKRVDLAIRGVGSMEHPPHLMIVGDGPLRAQLVALAEATAPGGVTFVPSQQDMRRVYWASEIVLLTSVSEGVPGVLIEAGLSGVPAVATDVGYVRDVVLDHRTGALVPTDDAAAVVDGLDLVLRNRERYGEDARRHCMENHEITRVTGLWVDLLTTIATTRDTHVSG